MKLHLYSFIAAACFALLLSARPAATTDKGVTAAAMPPQCRTGKTSPEAIGWRWKPGSTVTVYRLKGSFSAPEAEALARAVVKWNDALREINSDVVFTIGGERESIAQTDKTVTVLRGHPRVKERLGETRFYTFSNGAARITITMNPIVTDLDALTSLMTHELGHSLGLADCYKCKRGTTAMAAFRGENKSNGVYEPSACDRYVVAAGYAGLTNAHARLASAGQR